MRSPDISRATERRSGSTFAIGGLRSSYGVRQSLPAVAEMPPELRQRFRFEAGAAEPDQRAVLGLRADAVTQA